MDQVEREEITNVTETLKEIFFTSDVDAAGPISQGVKAKHRTRPEHNVYDKVHSRDHEQSNKPNVDEDEDLFVHDILRQEAESIELLR